MTDREPSLEPADAGSRMALLGRILENASQAFCLAYSTGEIVFANAAYCDLVGYTLDELLTLRWNDELTPVEWRDREAALVEAIIRTGRPARYEKEYIRKDGTRISVELVTAIERDERGQPYLYGFFTDLTARMREHRTLRESEERYRSLIEASPDGIVLVDREHVIVAANRRLAQQYGIEDPAALVGRSLASLLAPAERERATQNLRRRFQEHRLRPIRYRACRADGSEVWVEVTAAPIRDASGEVAQNVCVVRDITEQHALEEQLRAAQRMDAIGRVAGGVAHDFNNHLTVINGYCDIILAQLEQADPLREQVAEIRAAGRRAASLTQQLLVFSRQQVTEPRPLDLNTLVEDLQKMLRRLLSGRVRLTTRLGPAPGTVVVDPSQLQQVVVNLVLNARDAMPRGGTVEIATSRATLDEREATACGGVPAGEYVALSVRDTGIGMDAETRSRVFEPFFTTRKRGKGAGLGLPMVYAIVRQSGGGVRIESAPGEGTCLTVYLPHAESEPTAPVSPRSGRPELLGHETILVVDEHPQLRTLLRHILRGLGYIVLDAESADAACRLADGYRGTIHLLVTDVALVDSSGRTLAERLARSRPAMKVLYTSGYADDEQQKLLLSGAAHLAKPFEPERLALKVRDALGNPASTLVVLITSRDRPLRGVMRRVLQGAGYHIIEASSEKTAMELARGCQVDVLIADAADTTVPSAAIEIRRLQPAVRTLLLSPGVTDEGVAAARLAGVDAVMRKPIRPEEFIRTIQQLTEP